MKDKYLLHPWINHILYVSLLILTPFLMLQNYLQLSVKGLSDLKVGLAGIEVPVVVILAILLVLTVIIANYKKITLRILLVFGIIVIMALIGQYTSDYYLDLKLYDLQNNWHYFAYGIYSYVAYRTFRSMNFDLSKIVIYTFFSAILISTIDEGIQVFISSRIFDISDIAKDTWGVSMGLVLLNFGILNEGQNLKGLKFHNKKVADYIDNPKSLVILAIVLAYFLLLFASIMTSAKLWYMIILFTTVTFIIVFFILHFIQFHSFRNKFIMLIIFGVILQVFFFFKHQESNIVHNSKGLTVYKGIPIPYFDIMIYPNGTFRLVDKKLDFNMVDQRKICKQKADILIIGSGAEGDGGHGFPEESLSQFIFNPNTGKGMQVIIMKTPDACLKYNELKSKGLNVMCIINNT